MPRTIADAKAKAKKARRQARAAKAKREPNDPIVKLIVDNTKKRKISDTALARSRQKPRRQDAFNLPAYPPGVLPKGSTQAKHPLAMDEQIIAVNAWANQSAYAGAFANGITFLGYPYLAELSVIPEYRKITETIAMHMTRKFIKLKSAGEGEADENKTQKIKELTDELDNFKVRDVFRKLAEIDGYFGRAHLYIDFGYLPPSEMKMPIGDGRNDLSRLKVARDSLKGFKVIEPTWTYPMNYNSQDPTSFDWYNPQTWFVMQKEIHVSRLLKCVGHEVSDLLKPSFSFGGLSLSQMAKPYVDNWLRTRQSVADLIWSFSVSGVMTDLETIMQADGDMLFDRAELFNNLKNNRGMMILNKDSEEFFQVNTPLGTLDKLQAQAQEQMASISSIPLVFLLGITPSGLNASSEGEIRAFYDFIAAYQEKLFKDPLTRCIDFIQLSKYGEVDPDIVFEFEPLYSMTEKEEADIDKTNAETDDLRINGGVISPLEARKSVANNPATRYDGLRTDVLPIPPGGDEDDGGEEPPEIGGRGLDPGKPEKSDDSSPPPRGVDDDDQVFARDAAEFKEGDHPRGQPGNAGQFGPGGGSTKSGGKGPNDPQKISYRQVKTFGEYHEVAKASESHLSDEEKNAVNFYTSPEYKPLNAALRGGKKLSPETQQMVDHLDAALGKSALSEDLELYRGLTGAKTREMLDALMPGDVLTDNGYSSTAVHPQAVKDHIAGRGKGSTMVIRAPKGANVVFPGENSYNAQPNLEGGKTDSSLEAILPRKSKFKFVGKKGSQYTFELVPGGHAHDEAKWEESKHPRKDNGQFGSGGTAPSSEAQSKSHNDQVKKILGGKAGISNSYRNAIKDLLQSPHISAEDKTKLKHKMIESYSNKAAQLVKAGDHQKAQAVAFKAAKLASSMGAAAPKPPTPPVPSAPATKTETAAGNYLVDKSHAQPDKFILKNKAGEVLGNNGEFGSGIPTKKFDTQAAAEQAGKDFDENKKKQAEASAKAAEALKASQEAAKEQNKKYMSELGISETEAMGFHALVQMHGHGNKTTDLVEKFKDYEEKAKKLNYPISGFQYALIRDYINGGYHDINKALRGTSLTPAQHVYTRLVNNALDKLPKFTGQLQRGTTLTAEQIANYKPGHVIEEKSFTSTGDGFKFDGNVHYNIKAIGKRGADFSKGANKGEKEILFKAHTFFLVHSVETKNGKTTINMEEVEGHG